VRNSASILASLSLLKGSNRLLPSARFKCGARGAIQRVERWQFKSLRAG
jgi:hypothetical protein